MESANPIFWTWERQIYNYYPTDINIGFSTKELYIIINAYNVLDETYWTLGTAQNPGTYAMAQNPNNNLIITTQWQQRYFRLNGLTTTIYYETTPVSYINYDVINIPDLLFTIITMPFAFISQAFNLTLFEGTPYYVNVSNILLSLLAIAILITIIKIVMNKS